MPNLSSRRLPDDLVSCLARVTRQLSVAQGPALVAVFSNRVLGLPEPDVRKYGSTADTDELVYIYPTMLHSMRPALAAKMKLPVTLCPTPAVGRSCLEKYGHVYHSSAEMIEPIFFYPLDPSHQ